MSPSDAADLLADLPEERAEEILEEMEQEKAEDLRELLVHPEETAGGLMTTAYLSLPPEVTVETAIARLKAEAPNLDIIDYIYVVDGEEILQGVVSIRDLLTAQAHQPISEIQAPGWSVSSWMNTKMRWWRLLQSMDFGPSLLWTKETI